MAEARCKDCKGLGYYYTDPRFRYMTPAVLPCPMCGGKGKRWAIERDERRPPQTTSEETT